jgi:hypothetical protein
MRMHVQPAGGIGVLPMTEPSPLFVSVFCYALCKRASDPRAAVAAELADPKGSAWPGFRTLAQAQRIAPCVTKADGSTLITKARSRTAGHFLRAFADHGTDVWITCDDDVYADAETIGALVEVARATRGIVAAPCTARGWARMNVELEDPCAVSETAGAWIARARRVGFGLVALHVEAIRRTCDRSDLVRWVTQDGEQYPALFLEEVRLGYWIGEDYAACDRARAAGVDVFALLGHGTEHAGCRAMLSRDLQILLDPETARRFDEEAKKLQGGR